MLYVPNLKEVTSVVASVGVYLRLFDKERVRLRDNSRLWQTHQTIMQDFKAASEELGEKSKEAMALASVKKKLSKKILAASRSQNIYADSDRALLKQLIRNERVHSLVGGDEAIQKKHISELSKFRLGSEGENKRAHAIILDRREGPKLFSQIFSMDVEVRTVNGQIIRDEGPGNLELIKTTEPIELTCDENVRTYWTVSADESINGAGSATIKSASRDNNDRLVQMTTSPHRDFVKAHGREVLLAMDHDELMSTWDKYLLDGYTEHDPITNDERTKFDGVMGFHVKGMGAYVGARHINPESETDPFTMNYVYVPNLMATYKASAKRGEYAVSPDIYQELAASEQNSRVYCVSDPRFASKPDAPAVP